MSKRKPGLIENVQAGPGRRSMPLPVRTTYTLGELLPRRPDGVGTRFYKLPGEMGRELARAFERTFELVERGYGGLEVRSPSRLLTPRWHRVFERLHHHGLAQTLLLSMPLEQGIPLYYFDIGTPFFTHLTDGARPDLSRYSRGFSTDYDVALSKVVGECLERSTLTYFRMSDFVRASPQSLRAAGRAFLEPAYLTVFSDEQRERRPELRFRDDSVYRWTAATSLVTGRESLLPSQLIYWNYPVTWGDAPEPQLRDGSTHGAGGYFSVEGAVLSGLLECVQRDGFFLHWLRRVAPPRIDESTIKRADTLRLLAQSREVGLEPLFLDITNELGIPTCLAILLRSDETLPRVTMGGSCRLDGETAIHDALLEAASVHHLLAPDQTRLRLPEHYDPLTDPTFYTHQRLAYWANPEHASMLEFFLEGASISASTFSRGLVVSEDVRDNLAFVRSVLEKHGLDAWYVAAKHPALDALGYASVRVIMPELIPLYYEERNAPLGQRRLYDAAAFGTPMPILPPRSCPHPFP